MSLPTLWVAGNLKVPDLPDVIPVKYITQWVVQHSPDSGDKARLQDRILIVQSRTGSGKSTVLPVELFHLMRSKNTPRRQLYRGKSVLCTQPRIANAIMLATHDIPEYNPDMILGETIGYQTGSSTVKPPAGVIFATVGVLTQQLRTMEDSAIMGRYRFIIIDEAHERSKDVDVTLMRLKAFYVRNEGNPSLPFLLLASATIDVTRYAAFFGLGAANTVVITGSTHPIAEHYPATGTNDYLKEAAAVALRIHEQGAEDLPGKGDILIFVPGEADIKDIVTALQAYATKSDRPFLVLKVTREAVIEDSRDYRMVSVPHAELPQVNGRAPTRRILVATNVFETGVTVHSLRYVIDSGWSKSAIAYPTHGISGLIARPAPRSSILQRRGRVGRVFPGDFHPLYTQNVYNELDEQQLPEIIADGVTEIILDIIGEQQRQKRKSGAMPEFRVEDIDMLDTPPVEALRAALEFTLAAGFVSPFATVAETYTETLVGYGLTWMGKIAGRFSRTPPQGVRAILSCYVWGCSALDMITIVALFGRPISTLLTPEEAKKDALGTKAIHSCLSPFLVNKFGGGDDNEKGIRVPPSDDELALYRSRLIVADDFIEAMMVFEAFIGQLDASGGDVMAVGEWCEERGLSMEKLIEVASARETIINEVLVAGLNPFWGDNHRLWKITIDLFTGIVMKLKRSMYDGLRANLLKYDEKNNVYRTRFGLEVEVPPAFTDKEISKLLAIGVEGMRKPTYILTDRVNVKLGKKQASGKTPIMYKLKTTMVSVLDGFISVDTEFLAPRLCD
jgi:hypothetical protein